jgi:NADH:ubiquinone oxidoreductase subunit E/NAD-dependent dihydropyrimidine dehydrogenase PreA subunit
MNNKKDKKVGAVLVQGAGIAGVQASLDLANSGFKVYLVEPEPIIGGMMARLDKTFPTGDCATCIVSPKLVECARNLNIEILTLSELRYIEGEPGNFKATIKRHPRFVDEQKCTGCGVCTEVCPVKYEIFTDTPQITDVQLDEEHREAVDNILTEYRDAKGSLMSILKSVNKKFNYVPEDVLRYMAFKLDVPLSMLYRIVTFYNTLSLKPRGRHVISICAGTTCYVRGSEKILQNLRNELKVDIGGTTEDMRFTLEAVRCLGCCSLAPVISVNDEIHGNLHGNEVMEILQKYE